MDIQKLKPKPFVYNALCVVISILMMFLLISPTNHDGKFVIGIGEIIMIAIIGLSYVGYVIACIAYKQWIWLVLVSACLGSIGYCVWICLTT